MWSSPLPTNTLKIPLRVRQFSQKTNWKLTEDLLHNQSCKEYLYISRKDRKKFQRPEDGPGTPGRDL